MDLNWSIDQLNKHVSNLGSEWPKHHEGHKDCYLPEEAFPMIMHLLGLARRHQKKNYSQRCTNSRKKYLKRINNPNPCSKSKWREGHLASKTYRSLLQKLSGPKSDLTFLLFGLQPQRYRHLQGLRYMEMNNINGYNKTQQQMESESSFIPSIMCCQSRNPFFSIQPGENLQFNFQSLRELRS